MSSLSYPMDAVGIRLLFSFRKSKQTKALPKEKRQQVLISLSVNEVPTRSRYGSKVYGRPDQWSQQAQCFVGTTDEIRLLNKQLQLVHDRHLRILLEQTEEGKFTPTSETIRLTFTAKAQVQPMLLEAFRAFIACLTTVEQRQQTTLKKWRFGAAHLTGFVKAVHRAKDLPLGQINIKWAKAYLDYLLKLKTPSGQAKMNRTTASIYVKQLVAVLDFMIEEGHLEVNSLSSLKLRQGPGKPIYFLEDVHIDRLAKLPLTGTKATVRDAALMMCYTGLDPADLRQVLNDPAKYMVSLLGGGQKIIVHRGKTAVQSQIPLLPGVADLLARYSNPCRMPTHAYINLFLKKLQKAIDFPHRLTCKICRKTAGSLFLNAGFSIEVVQQILGHTKASTTQKHYARIYDKRVDAEMSRVGMFTVPLSQPRHSA